MHAQTGYNAVLMYTYFLFLHVSATCTLIWSHYINLPRSKHGLSTLHGLETHQNLCHLSLHESFVTASEVNLRPTMKTEAQRSVHYLCLSDVVVKAWERYLIIISSTDRGHDSFQFC